MEMLSGEQGSGTHPGAGANSRMGLTGLKHKEHVVTLQQLPSGGTWGWTNTWRWWGMIRVTPWRGTGKKLCKGLCQGAQAAVPPQEGRSQRSEDALRHSPHAPERRPAHAGTREGCAPTTAVEGTGYGQRDGAGNTHAFLHESQRPLSKADQPHAVVDPSRPQSPLGDFEASARSQQHIRLWHAHVFK